MNVTRCTGFIVPPLWLLAVACGGSGPGPRTAGFVGDSAVQASAVTDSGELAAFLALIFTEGMAREQIPGAVFVLVAAGRVVLAQGYGVADVASGRPVDPATTIFPIASISKLFNRYLTSVRVPTTYPQPISAAHLLAHTSGLDELPGRRDQIKEVRSFYDSAKFREVLSPGDQGSLDGSY